MKKMRILILLIVSLFATSIPIQAVSSKAVFDGDIKTKYNFLVGDKPVSDDFIINGTILHNGNVYDDIIVTWLDSKVTEEKTRYSIAVNVKGNFGIAVPTFIEINSKDFSSKLKSNIENKTIVVDKTSWLSEDGLDETYYTNTLNEKMTNLEGKKINGKFTFSKEWRSPRIGTSNVTYRFDPSDKRYDTYYGGFTVQFTQPPKIVTTESGIRISLSNRDDRYTFKVNGKVYKKNIIGKLNSNTEYNLEIIQNTVSTNAKSTLASTTEGKSLYTTTVKTKTVTIEEE